MNTKVIIGIAVLVVVVGGGYLLFRGQKGTTQPSNPTNNSSQTTTTNTQNPTSEPGKSVAVEEATITYTSSGFSPSKITVKSGGKITWVNSSDREVAVGANPHPLHTGNREVSGGEFTLNLKPGEQKTVTVEKVGTFGYHNHLNASEDGTIVVE